MARKITQYSLEKASEHIYYEALMFFETVEQLKYSNDPIKTNILLDAFAIHTRNLFDFLYPTRPQDDDIVVSDYLRSEFLYRRRKTKKKDLEFVARKTNKQVVHLTYARNRYSSKTKPWPFVEIERKMRKSLSAFCESLPEQYKKWSFFEELMSLL